MKILIVGVHLCFFGSSTGLFLASQDEPPHKALYPSTPPCKDELHLTPLIPSRQYTNVHIWFGKVEQIQLDAQQREIECVSEWAAGLKDERLRKEYESWLEYYQNAVNEARAK
jgi:hypothetical protein